MRSLYRNFANNKLKNQSLDLRNTTSELNMMSILEEWSWKPTIPKLWYDHVHLQLLHLWQCFPFAVLVETHLVKAIYKKRSEDRFVMWIKTILWWPGNINRSQSLYLFSGCTSSTIFLWVKMCLWIQQNHSRYTTELGNHSSFCKW